MKTFQPLDIIPIKQTANKLDSFSPLYLLKNITLMNMKIYFILNALLKYVYCYLIIDITRLSNDMPLSIVFYLRFVCITNIDIYIFLVATQM